MSQRPLAISAVCVLGALASLYASVLLLSTWMWAVQPTLGERATGLAAVAVAVAALYGMWRMRRWGVFLLGAAVVARITFALAQGQPWTWATLAGPAAVLLVGLTYFRRMT